jgi:hypothetical protein
MFSTGVFGLVLEGYRDPFSVNSGVRTGMTIMVGSRKPAHLTERYLAATPTVFTRTLEDAEKYDYPNQVTVCLHAQFHGVLLETPCLHCLRSPSLNRN